MSDSTCRRNEVRRELFGILAAITLAFSVQAQQKGPAAGNGAALSKVWVADKGDGTYRNPVLHADYSDPDAVRVGNSYYLTASSFNQVPGLPILQSYDLVNWRILGYAFSRQVPAARYDTVTHGGGVWAPAIRYHQGTFYIYYPDPDVGIWMAKATNPAGPWSEPLLVKAAKGWIDPCPFWDEDGKAYLVSAMAASRSGVKSVLIVSRMSADGTKLLDDGTLVFDGHGANPTVEGPKLYKRNGYYYIFAPAGGVGTGWQLALRSKNIYGPYEQRIVLEQGKSEVNGPHQGAWVETPGGQGWFLHFQDKDAYGRVVHLQPMRWKNDWPEIGVDADGNGIGEPVLEYTKPNVGKTYARQTPADRDEFNDGTLGPQWQWPANPRGNQYFPAGKAYGFLRLTALPVPEGRTNAWFTPQLLTQKFPAPNFTATTKCTFTAMTDGEEAGLVVTGIDYAAITIRRQGGSYTLYQFYCPNAETGGKEQRSPMAALSSNTVYLRVQVTNRDSAQAAPGLRNTASSSRYGNATCTFSYSTDGVQFITLGPAVAARKGKWIGARVGLFAQSTATKNEYGFADFDWFRVE